MKKRPTRKKNCLFSGGKIKRSKEQNCTQQLVWSTCEVIFKLKVFTFDVINTISLLKNRQRDALEDINSKRMCVNYAIHRSLVRDEPFDCFVRGVEKNEKKSSVYK